MDLTGTKHLTSHCANPRFTIPQSSFSTQLLRLPPSFLRPRRKTAAVSCHLIPGHLEGSFAGKKSVSEPTKKLQFVRTLLIDNYDSYTYNIFQELSVINGVPPTVIHNDEWTWEELCHYLYEEKAFDNVVISPGPGSPACPDDIGICIRLLHECRDIPILGVCLGHQALGYVHGARVVRASEPVHGRLSDIEHAGGRLFNQIPSGRDSGFKVVRYHSLTVDPESLPKELLPIAWTASDAVPFRGARKLVSSINGHKRLSNHRNSVESVYTKTQNGKPWNTFDSTGMPKGEILMGIMHRSSPHYGLQFHPESIATSYGRKIFENFREITEDYWFGLRASSVKERKVHSAACMQVPDIGRMFQDTRIGGHLLHSYEHKHFSVRNMRKSSGMPLLKLTWKKLESSASQMGGSRNIFCNLLGDHRARNTFWLDSSSVEKGRARFSYMGGKGGSLWKQLTFRLSKHSDSAAQCGGYLSMEDAQGSTTNTYLEQGFLNFLNKELQSYCYDPEDYEGLPFDFYGGYVGYIGYDLKVECGVTCNRHKSGDPDACFFFADNLIVVDHQCDDIYIMCLHDESTRTDWLDDIELNLINLRASTTNKLISQAVQNFGDNPVKLGFSPEKSKEQYIEDIQKCQEFIKDGESYELCLTTQMRKKFEEMDPLGLYLHLREKNPAPYAAWLNFSKEQVCICCSSPERFLRLDRNGTLEAKPIKGTIARGSTLEDDEMLKLQLQYSEKDQAENLMIVDLLRNDLGRICEPGTVHVPKLMEIESYATVHTMVSTIRGKKQSEVSPVDCIRVAFPGGSMTGAPKLRSMELLDSIESCSRGIYSGCIGFFSYNQTFDLNIVIRTVVVQEGEASIGAGGAITALSNPDDEYEEMMLKTKAPSNAVMGCLSSSS